MASWDGLRVFTVGHSNRTLDELVALLANERTTDLADVRTVPRSRRNPQFDTSHLARALPTYGIRYHHLQALGGMRTPRPDSTNRAWHEESFRGYADHMETAAFDAGLARLRELAERGAVAVMCAEASPHQCHRQLLADALVARGAAVVHITGPETTHAHALTPFARVVGERVTYPALL